MKARISLMNNLSKIQLLATDLLKDLIAIPSFSGEEQETAQCIETFFLSQNIQANRQQNNVWAINKYNDSSKPTLLLNSHHDTVKPNPGYRLDPFKPQVTGGKLFGLGSNDAGGPLVSLIATFLHYYEQKDLKYNLLLAATAEEENSGKNGIESLLPLLGKIDCAIVGEPTLMQMAIAERGLLVLDCIAKGKAGHAARKEGTNAIYAAMKDIELMRQIRFEKTSELLGEVSINVTVINTENKAHNMVPDTCNYVADVRVNELYTLEEVLQTIRENVSSEVTARSMRMRSSGIPINHPLIRAGVSIGKTFYGSPTTSDKALIPAPALKMGPGDSARSHSSDEFIYLHEIASGIEDYIKMLKFML